MTEKQFEKVVYGEEDECGSAWKIVDNATDKEYTKPYMIVDCMNKLADENEQLKFELKECREHKLFSRRQLEKENEQLKKENQMLNQRLIELDDLKWVREHTVWEQMPTRVKTYTKTSLNGDSDD